ncbi:hypothetical protein BGZ65_006684 [Modicella reniformis]|uniref:Uncharacterized protein n=1 Tax=Modicella reniformis TaxID=1440133 RepID=A0A9P6IVZ5_9FUNG|nr:hypothetical protein BGZ65_006684 [Modicella reniformis]
MPQAPKPGTAGAPAPAKKKDPYATAWRTYSKIAEELNLVNPDGTLYPISKEAILKYLHHQSKRIKSSNLHWYVNGLKKHQENLGIAWDDVRYDEQVVALLKELTLHPVTVDSGGGARLVSPTSMEGDEPDEGEANSKGAQGSDGHDLEDMDEDHRERMALKRHASTGTLRVQDRVSAMTSISDQHLYQRQGDEYHHNRDFSTTTPSPAARENEAGGHFRWGSSETALLQNRLSPPSGSTSSIGSISPANRSNNRHRRPNGVVSSPIATVTSGIISVASGSLPAAPLPQSPSALLSANKTTVQFSEVVEYAQQLQIKYGNRCRDHRWGCVELSEDVHLELTIKMYMDWAGLVASGRLSMDDLPDLPEFKRPGGVDSHDASMSPTPGPAVVIPGATTTAAAVVVKHDLANSKERGLILTWAAASTALAVIIPNGSKS